MSSPSAPSPKVGRVQRSRLYEQIIQQLVEHIRQVGLRVGDRLPAERELAASLGVSRASLAQALVALEVLGTISVRHGEGAVIVNPPTERLLDTLRERRNILPDILDARAALETKLAALAARRRTEEDLGRIAAALDLMEREIVRGKPGLEGDQAFHEAVTAAAGSPVLARLMREIRELIHETRIESLTTPGRPEASLASHRSIARAIEAGEPRVAADAMAEHIDSVSAAGLLGE